MLVPTIGIEVHVELKSNAKVFSKSKNNFNDAINTNVSVIDLGYPGVLPQLNKKVIDMALIAALVLNCEINKKMHFDRKNYFYPDLPKGYQITQSRTPIGHDGYVTIFVDGKEKRIGIERIHIEEDTCKSIHNGDMTLLNFNRAGVPLIEIVSKPDITSSKEAVLYIEALREMLLYLGISDVKIEEGSMRCDANVSLKEETSSVLGTKTEIKNIGSISNVGTSIEYEIKRQKEILTNGGIITEETRRFDDKKEETILMRVKETGNDYRYYPDPDIPYVILTDEWINDAKERIPVLPSYLRTKYLEYGINNNNINTLINNIELSEFLSNINSNYVVAANLLCGDVLNYLNKNYLPLNDTKLDSNRFNNLISLISDNKISSKQAKDILPVLLETNKDLDTIIKELGISQISDDKLLLEIVKNIVENNPDAIEDYKAGRDRAIKYLMGLIMKETKGQANPQIVNSLLLKELGHK